MERAIDLRVDDCGSVVMLEAVTDNGRVWLLDNVAVESWQWFGNAVACEPRMVEAVIEGAVDDGLEIG